jgi:hypothetical protein
MGRLDPRRTIRASVSSVVFERRVPGGNTEDGSVLLCVRVRKEDCKDMPTFGIGDVVELSNTGESVVGKKPKKTQDILPA